MVRYMESSGGAAGTMRLQAIKELYKPESILRTHCDSPLVKIIYSERIYQQQIQLC